ncbi:DUF3570 domain-containing protein [Granulosicoccus antarcticus]|uniref:DUF3570 domain-containing protein n=1 Tax=Granulosicoccus antarcticus IMCC3135 TaxID=1192854 RepID=A0A2Z2NGC2_9GAMM|nr:DUF3570 domain-containing protein [Granulosicoccus antarcticus]ASJ70249.1 hypothetical protein IMCC3135_00615 [Granulosicoccus antarcticus IMCC3135]
MVVAVLEAVAVAVTDSSQTNKSRHPSIRATLGIATGALLASGGVSADWLPDLQDWETSAGLMYYSESGRVSAIEPVISAKKNLDTDEYLTLKLTLDTLTGASATGAVSSELPQTFTRPSGNGSYTIASGQTPLDDTFKDTRLTFNANWERPVAEELTLNLGTALSKEYDYLSLGISGGLAKDINAGNTTLSGGLSLSADSGSPVGGEPIPFAAMQPEDTDPLRQGSGSDKQVIDAVFGLTQIINKRSLFQINYSLSSSDGYLNDPYKFISVVDPITGNPVFENSVQPDLPTVAYENRPDSRTKHSLYAQYKIALGDNILDSSYRFLTDDWGINSHTLDFRYRIASNNGSYWQPHIRLYQQSAADFYTPFFVGSERPVSGDSHSFASADYRLGEFTATTLGLEYGRRSGTRGWSVAAEYYLQSGKEPDKKFGALADQTLFPDVDAFFVRFIRDF